jgi:hypothetical protein
MAGRVFAQWEEEPDDLESWMAWRNARLDQQHEADAFGRDLWNGATRSGDNLWGGQPSDLTALGLAALGSRIEPESNGQAGGGASVSQASHNPAVADESTEPSLPDYRIVTAQPGDSISRLMGTSGPDAIGRFASLNGLKNSGLQAGQSYRVPVSYEGATPNESAIGSRLLRSDNARLAATGRVRVAAAPAPDDLFAQRLNGGQNVWTGKTLDNPSVSFGRTMPAGSPNRLDRAAKVVGGTVAYVGGVAVGLPLAAYHAARDVKDLGEFGLDAAGAFGPEAQQNAYRGATDATHSILQYGRAVRNDPSRIVSDVGDLSKEAIGSVDPFDAPMSGTFGDVVAHEFGKGENLGEGVANIAASVAAPELEFGAIRAANFGATKAARVAKLVEKGANPRLAEYLAEPYTGMGHHALVPRRFKVPQSIMGIPVDERWVGKPLPSWIVDGPLNVSVPMGMSRDDFYKYHYGVDGHFHGARLPADLNGGKGWSGKREGARRYHPALQVWAGMPVPLKGGLAAVGIGDGFGVPQVLDQGTPR